MTFTRILAGAPLYPALLALACLLTACGDEGEDLQGTDPPAVAEVRVGNAFTNANKALAHVMAYGRDTLTAPPPRLCGASLERHGLLPQHGYLQEQAPS